ncbi:unnamed protein product, partial [Rotaria sp. Silwood1]
KSIEKVNNSSLSSLLSSTSRKDNTKLDEKIISNKNEENLSLINAKNENKKSVKKESLSTSLLQIPTKRRLHLTHYHTNDNTNDCLSTFIISIDQSKKENK